MNDDELYDSYAEKFDSKDWPELMPDIINYFSSKPYAIDSFKEWWIDNEIENRNADNDAYLAEQAWADFVDNS